MQWTNFFDWMTYIFSFLLVFDVRENSNITGEREVIRVIGASLALVMLYFSVGNGNSAAW